MLLEISGEITPERMKLLLLSHLSCLTLCDPIDGSPPGSFRLLRPWDSPGKNTEVGCHFLLQCMKVKSESEVSQSCPTLSEPRDCSLPGFSVHGIFQARVLGWGAIALSGKNEGMEQKQKQHPVVNGTGDESKVWGYKEQYSMGTWNIRSRSPGKLELVKQEMTRVNINILGIGELRWPGMDEFNSNDHYITTVVRSPLEEME